MYDKESYHRNLESHRRSWVKRQARNAEYANTYKTSRGCVLCGYNRCARSLDFHHTGDDKEANVARLVTQGASLARVQAEIAKCVVLCRNCHGEVHDGFSTLP